MTLLAPRVGDTVRVSGSGPSVRGLSREALWVIIDIPLILRGESVVHCRRADGGEAVLGLHDVVLVWPVQH